MRTVREMAVTRAAAAACEPPDPMTGKRGVLLRFMTLYAVLFSAFEFASPFLPAFLAERELGSEDIGFVFGTTWALRLVCGPIAGRLADRLQTFRTELAVCAILAASDTLLYLASYSFWTVMVVGLIQAARAASSTSDIPRASAFPKKNGLLGPGHFRFSWNSAFGRVPVNSVR
jgi:MFS transporter, PPP family, 3-phenylpropionic acid transporter